MATLTLTITPNPATVGQELTARYAFTGPGSADEPAIVRDVQVKGTATLDGVEYDYDSDVELTKPPVIRVRSYDPPIMAGVTFVPTSDPAVFKGTAALA